MTSRLGSAPRARPESRRTRRRSAANRACARATMASSAGSRGPQSAGAKLLRRVAKVLDRRGGSLAPLELLAVPVDPDHRDVHLQQRSHVGVVPRPDVDPALLAADPACALL